MKKLLLSAILLTSINAKSQTKDTTKTDSLNLPLITISDFQIVLNELSNSKAVTPNEFTLLQQFSQKIISEAIQRRKIKANKK